MSENEELREKLAAVQHEIWSHWMQYMFNQCRVTANPTIPAVKAARWFRQMNTPYDELSEQEKESDRDQADKVLRVLYLSKGAVQE